MRCRLVLNILTFKISFQYYQLTLRKHTFYHTFNLAIQHISRLSGNNKALSFLSFTVFKPWYSVFMTAI